MLETIIRKIFESPAAALEKGIDSLGMIGKNLLHRKPVKQAGAYWRMLGPGLTTGAADDDPSGIATYSQAGASYGFGLVWLAAFTFPLMAIIQEMCARIGLATGQGLAGNIKDHCSRWMLYTCTILLFLANTFNIGADLGAMAKSVQLVAPHLDFALIMMGIALVSLCLQIFTTYERYASYLKWLALLLFSYVISAFAVHIEWGSVLSNSLFPSITFSKDWIYLVTAVLGTTISPYLFFWQTSQEVEEEMLKTKEIIEPRAVKTSEEIKNMRVDVWSGMFISNLVMFFIITICGATLFPAGIRSIDTATQAASALRPLAGNGAYVLFMLGIIGTGMLAIPVLAGSTSYAFSESFGWPRGLHYKLKEAQAFYGVIIMATVIGIAMNLVGIDPIKALVYSAIANAFVAPFIIYLIIKIASSGAIMGEWKNRPLANLFGWIIFFLMFCASAATLLLWFM